MFNKELDSDIIGSIEIENTKSAPDLTEHQEEILQMIVKYKSANQIKIDNADKILKGLDVFI